MLNVHELNRYSRHILLSEIGEEGQEKLKTAKVLVVGAGGLGCPVLQYLTAAGIGVIGIIDFDVVDESNLQRQVLYDIKDIGKNKAIAAGARLKEQNPFVTFNLYPEKLTSGNAIDIISCYDIIVDGSDNFPTRYLVNDACVAAGKPLVFGSIYKFEGQVTVLNFQGSGSYRCLFPEAPAEGDVPNCSVIGVLGVLPGIIGTIQANEVLKIVLKIGEVLAGKLLTFDALALSFQQYAYKKDPKNFLPGLLKIQAETCSSSDSPIINEITAAELQKMKDSHEDFDMIDVREFHEYERQNLAGMNIPLGSLEKSIDKISKTRRVVIYCQSGGRSRQAINKLKEKYGFENLWNLQGGMNEFMKLEQKVIT